MVFYFDFLLRATTQSFISCKKINFVSLDMILDRDNNVSDWLIPKSVFFYDLATLLDMFSNEILGSF